MKKLSLFVSAFALCASTSYAAVDCGTLPSCDDLGYSDTVSQCPNQNKILYCPFDNTKGKCLHTAEIGDVKYSLKNKDHDGWLLCDGRVLKQNDYSLLYGVIQQKFCFKYTAKEQQSYSPNITAYVGGKCSAGNFALPDYRGFYLRSMMTQRGDSIDAHSSGYYSNALYYMGGAVNEYGNYHTEHSPMYARLPNIWGEWWAQSMMRDNASSKTPGLYGEAGALYLKSFAGKGNMALGNSNHDFVLSGGLGFDASKSNAIYSTNSPFVIPASYGVYTFIYAGKK